MKILGSLLIATFAVSAMAERFGGNQGPLLAKEIGVEGRTGLATTCQILMNHKDAKDLAPVVAQAYEDSLDKFNYEQRTYVQFNAPSKEYYAIHAVPKPADGFDKHKVKLLSDGGSYSALKTEAGKTLIATLNKLCAAADKKPGAKGEAEEEEK